MTKQSVYILLISLLIVAIATGILLEKRNNGHKDFMPVELRALKLPNGWGYEVLMDKKVYIHQDCIPAISSFKSFISDTEALTIGRKVVEKIRQGKPHSISQQEIDEANIHY